MTTSEGCPASIRPLHLQNLIQDCFIPIVSQTEEGMLLLLQTDLFSLSSSHLIVIFKSFWFWRHHDREREREREREPTNELNMSWHELLLSSHHFLMMFLLNSFSNSYHHLDQHTIQDSRHLKNNQHDLYPSWSFEASHQPFCYIGTSFCTHTQPSQLLFLNLCLLLFKATQQNLHTYDVRWSWIRQVNEKMIFENDSEFLAYTSLFSRKFRILVAWSHKMKFSFLFVLFWFNLCDVPSSLVKHHEKRES
jgi:hypothetical protein